MPTYISSLLAMMAALAVIPGGTANRTSCGQEAPSEALLKTHQELASKHALTRRQDAPSTAGVDGIATVPITIDLYIHVLAEVDMIQNLTTIGQATFAGEDIHTAKPKNITFTRENLLAPLAKFNEAFAPFNISFVFKSIDYAVHPEAGVFLSPITLRRLRKGSTADVLNMYFVQSGWKHRFRPAGRGTFPADLQGPDGLVSDGVVLRLPAALDPDAITMIHEGGHWLGLLHTFGRGCEDEGDLVEDTPAEDTGMAQSFPSCQVRDSCPDQPGLDPIHNFMSLNNDGCASEFTPGQGQRMRDLFFRYRATHSGEERDAVSGTVNTN